MHWNDWEWGMGGGMILWTLFIIAVVIALVVLVARNASAAQRPKDLGDSPEEILKRRYARGEIDRDEYERRLSDLRR